MKYNTFPYPYDYQPEGANLILESLRNPGPKRTAGYVSPTGSGKSTVEALCLEQEPDLHVICPKPLIAAGIHEALTGIPKETCTQAMWESRRIFTDMRYLNLLSQAKILPPKHLLIDEFHHSVADTHGNIWDLAGRCPRAGLTATPYRGTPDSTEALRESADSWRHIINLGDAISRGVISLPRFTTVPLFDDETIDIGSDGEFTVKSSDRLVKSRLDALLEFLAGFYHDGLWSDPGTLVLPGTASINLLMDAMESKGLPAVAIVSDTRDRDRLTAFAKTMARTHLLLQIRAVGEGVDFPLRMMFDASPSTSPSLVMQRWGRLFRPGGLSRCYSLCHNYLRHAYLLEGTVPTGSLVQARTAWGKEWKPGRNLMTRALGNMGLGRFKPTEVPTADGGGVYLYALKAAQGAYAALLLPAMPHPYYFQRDDTAIGTAGMMKGGRFVQYVKKSQSKWRRVERLPPVENAASLPPDRVSDRTLYDWVTYGKRHGLDAGIQPDAKQAVLMRILLDTGLSIA